MADGLKLLAQASVIKRPKSHIFKDVSHEQAQISSGMFLRSQNQSFFLGVVLFALLCFKPDFHMIVTVSHASLRQARGHIEDGCVRWKHLLNDVANQTGTLRGRI